MIAKTHLTKQRLDLLMAERGLAPSRTAAQSLIMAGQVVVNGQPATKPGATVPTDVRIEIAERLPFVSRGGLKLQAALDAFALDVHGWVAADVGASTGGFTDCLLQRGAAGVYAIDVGYGQLAWSLRQNERVVVMERVNARYLESLPEPIDLAVVDASFISLTLLLPRIYQWLKPQGQVVALIKPQFEAGKDQVGQGGVVRDKHIHRQVLEHILTWCRDHDLPPQGLIRSPITGPAGNVEFLALLRRDDDCTWPIEPAVQAAVG